MLPAPAQGATAQTTTVLTDADSYVEAVKPTTNYGTAKLLRTDKTPRVSYMRFTPPALPGTVTKATLRVYTTTASQLGFEARAVATTAWNERTVTYNVRPATGALVSAYGAFAARQWLSLDVSSAIRDRSQQTLALTSSQLTDLQIYGREQGTAYAPRLLIDTITDTAPPSVPAAVKAVAGDAKVALTWSPSTDDVKTTGYRIYQNGALIGSSTTPDFTATGLVNGTTYSYTVKAFDYEYHYSALSAPVTAKPMAPGTVTPPPPPPPPPPPVGDPVLGLRPYDARSAWNTQVGTSAVLSNSASLVNAIADNAMALTSDPDQYAIPVYPYDASTPRRTVTLSGYFSSYDNGDDSRVGYGFAPTIADVPIPDGVMQSAGTDGQIVLSDPATGTEYSFWQFDRDAAGNYIATNGVRYHTGTGSYGRFADGLSGRGAGMPYSAGLVRRWEMDQGRIDHALAFAYNTPSSQFVYPASKSDGLGTVGVELPEGSRLALDPSLTEADFTAWGLSAPAKVIARALQSYGMYVVDSSGSSKIFMEDRLTAKWDAGIDRNLTSKIPWSAFRVISAPAAP